MSNVLNRDTKEYFTSVNTPNYPTRDWIINPDLTAVVGTNRKYWKIVGDTVSLMTKEERDVVDDDLTNLTALKQQRYQDIDNKTQTLISQGFIFDRETFSLSSNAQNTWMGLQIALVRGSLTSADFPLPISTKADYEYVLADEATAISFFGAAVVAYKSHLDSGRALKKAIFEAGTKIAVDAVIDSR